jgi:ACT domain-containing protein
MIMLVELENLNCDFSSFATAMKVTGEENGVEISVMHEDIFNTMHKI